MISNRQLHLQHLAATNPFPLMLEIKRAEGIYLYSAEDKRYFDLISGISVSALGHNYPDVIRAVKAQVEKHMHVMVYGEFVQEPQSRYAALISKVLPEKLDCVYFVNSGAEATEGALKLARKATGRYEIAYFRNSYHGSTAGALSVLGDESLKQAFRPLIPGNLQLDYNDIEQLQQITTSTAAVLAETVQAESGVLVPNVDYMKALRRRCDEVGALLILDEVQCGMGRTGALFCFEHFGIVPDVLLLAKAFGGGMPLGAFVSGKEIMATLASDPMLGHITTFGGHPVSCAAGLETLKVILEKDLFMASAEKGKLIKNKLKSNHIRSVNSMGLLMAVEFADFESNRKVIERCFVNGVITDWFLFNNRSLRIAPPLIISEDEIEESCSIINQSISEALD